MIRNLLTLCSVFLILSCSTNTPPQPVEKIVTKTEKIYHKVPEEILVCPLPPIVDPDTIETEKEFNERFVLEIYINNIICFDSINDVHDFNKSLDSLNDENSNSTSETTSN